MRPFGASTANVRIRNGIEKGQCRVLCSPDRDRCRSSLQVQEGAHPDGRNINFGTCAHLLRLTVTTNDKLARSQSGTVNDTRGFCFG